MLKVGGESLGGGAGFGAPCADRAITLGKLVDAAGGVDKPLFTREERMAGRADADAQILNGRLRVIHRATGAGDRGFVQVWMQVFFHGKRKHVCRQGRNCIGRGVTGVQAISQAIGVKWFLDIDGPRSDVPAAGRGAISLLAVEGKMWEFASCDLRA